MNNTPQNKHEAFQVLTAATVEAACAFKDFGEVAHCAHPDQRPYYRKLEIKKRA